MNRARSLFPGLSLKDRTQNIGRTSEIRKKPSYTEEKGRHNSRHNEKKELSQPTAKRRLSFEQRDSEARIPQNPSRKRVSSMEASPEHGITGPSKLPSSLKRPIQGMMPKSKYRMSKNCKLGVN